MYWYVWDARTKHRVAFSNTLNARTSLYLGLSYSTVRYRENVIVVVACGRRNAFIATGTQMTDYPYLYASILGSIGNSEFK